VFTVLIFGQFPLFVPPKSDIQFLLQRGGATICRTLADFVLLAVQLKKRQKIHGDSTLVSR
jgi:hypothetical protein